MATIGYLVVMFILLIICGISAFVIIFPEERLAKMDRRKSIIIIVFCIVLTCCCLSVAIPSIDNDFSGNEQPTSRPQIQPTSLPTSRPQIQPTSPPPQAVCNCSGDVYNCSSFSGSIQAQACFNYCRGQGRGDVHQLDRDNDGLACEWGWLPYHQI